MEKDIKAHKSSCNNCGAPMRYLPEKKCLYCENCKSCKAIESVIFTEKNPWGARNNVKHAEWVEETTNLKCPSCGASVVLNKLEYSKECPYCGNNLVGEEVKDSAMAPDAIIPFALSNKTASELYQKGIKKKWFAPNAFKKAPPVEDIKGIYIPTFGYDADTSSSYNGTLGIHHTHRDSNGNTHKTVTYRHISGNHNSLQRDVLVETSSKLNQAQFEKILPFNVSKAVDFNQDFIMGYTVEAYENSLEECKKIADNIMSANVKREILSKYHYDEVVRFDMKMEQRNVKYAQYLLPVYKCDYKFKNKNYTTLMNGQTGKVGGGYPKSPVKITFFVLMILAIIAGFAILFAVL